MLKFLILFLLLTFSHTFFFNQKNKWERFFIKSQEVIKPISTRKIVDIDKIKIFELETNFLKKELQSLGNVDYNNINYNVNNFDELMIKGVLPITSKGGSICGLVIKLNIPKVDLILGFSLRNKYNDILQTYQPLDSTKNILEIYQKCNSTGIAANHIMNGWLLNKPYNYSYLKELFYDKEINDKEFINDCYELVNSIDNFYNEILN